MKKLLESLWNTLPGMNRPKEQAVQPAKEKAETQMKNISLFVAAGKPYYSEAQLMDQRLHPEELIYKDVYGRRVLLINERYPTFDSYDALYENRYFHYYYIQTPEGFTCVRTADDQDDIPVREGISAESFIWENKLWKGSLLRAAGLIPEEKK